MCKVSGWLYASIAALSLGLFIVGITLKSSLGVTEKLQQKVIERDAEFQKQIVDLNNRIGQCQRIIQLQQGALNQQDEVNAAFLSFMKAVNSRDSE